MKPAERVSVDPKSGHRIMNNEKPEGGRHRNRLGFTGRVNACRKFGCVRGTKLGKGKHVRMKGNSKGGRAQVCYKQDNEGTMLRRSL